MELLYVLSVSLYITEIESQRQRKTDTEREREIQQTGR